MHIDGLGLTRRGGVFSPSWNPTHAILSGHLQSVLIVDFAMLLHIFCADYLVSQHF